MATDDERREVAERLREKSRKYARELYSSHTSINAYHGVREVLYGTDGAPKSLCEFFDRLADLIEPSESGQNRDRNQDTVQKESPGVQMACECDREALMELAEDVTEAAEMATAVDASKSAEMLAELLLDIARRIREALGVSDD